jgi:hypothetical protein
MSHTEPAAVAAAIGTPTSVISVRPVVLTLFGAEGDSRASGRLESK